MGIEDEDPNRFIGHSESAYTLSNRITHLEEQYNNLMFFLMKTLDVQTELTHSLKNSIMDIVGMLPFIRENVRREMEKQIGIVNRYTIAVKKQLGIK